MGPQSTSPPAASPTQLNGQQSPSFSRTSTARAPAEPNIHNVVLGNIQVKPWYPSFYPEELVGRTSERLYVCPWCFKYSKELMPYLGHSKACPLRAVPPPGIPIYRKDQYTIYEVDGDEHKLYAQNLSLFAKLFLDTKSVFYDVTTFLYYLLVSDTPTADDAQSKAQAPQVVGFFSKEKMSWDNNNLACILVFPPWQRQGLGQLLMGVSYELSKREGRLGGPEKPLSTLGRLAYTNYWSHTLSRTLLARHVPTPQSHQKNPPTSVRELSAATGILPEDIVATLQSMELLERRRRAGQDQAVVDKVRVRTWAVANNVKESGPLDGGGFLTAKRENGED